jgi:hypothetical protein
MMVFKFVCVDNYFISCSVATLFLYCFTEYSAFFTKNILAFVLPLTTLKKGGGKDMHGHMNPLMNTGATGQGKKF